MAYRILVSGGAGFIGSHIVDALLEKGHRVVVVDNLLTGRRENLPKEETKNFGFYNFDICSENISGIFQKEMPDFVYHTAAQINVRKSVEDPLFDAKVNILGSLNILQNCVKNKVKKIIFSSTGGAIYGDTNLRPTKEDFFPQPDSPYAIAKLSVENYLKYYFKFFGLNYTILRYANVFGPRQNAKSEAGVVSIFCENLINNKQPTIFGSGNKTRDYVFVKDVVAANLLALEKGGNKCYNVGTGLEISVKDLYFKIANLLESKILPIYGEEKKGEIVNSCLDFSKINGELGWKPDHDLEQGLRETVGYFKMQN